MGEIANKSDYPQNQNKGQIWMEKFLAHVYDFHNETQYQKDVETYFDWCQCQKEGKCQHWK